MADGTPYKAIIQVKGNDYSVRTDSGEFSNTAEKENAWTEDLTPCFGIGARAVAGSVFSDMKMYIKDVEIANYIVDMKVNAPAYVEKGAALTGVTADVKYADGSTATLSQDELTISGFSSAVSGKKRSLCPPKRSIRRHPPVPRLRWKPAPISLISRRPIMVKTNTTPLRVK